MTIAIFYPDPHPESTCFDGYAERGISGTWSQVRDGSGTFSDSGETFVGTIRCGVGSLDGANWANVDRMILLFDTSSLPDDAVISSASLNLFTDNAASAFGGSVVVCSSTPVSNVAIQNSDYSQLGTTALSAPRALSTLTEARYHSFPLNSTGIAAIDVAGITKLGLRIESDLNNSEPALAAGNDRLFAVSREAGGTSQGPYLAVEYSVAAAPSPTYASTGIFARRAIVGTFARREL